MSSTDAAAWWGAIVASMILIWDVYKWIKSGTALRLNAVPDKQLLYDEIPKPTDTKYINVDVSNTGDKKTTVTHLVGVCHTSLWRWLFRRKPDINFFVPTPGFAKPLPYVLQPGEKWSGTIEQTKQLEDWMKTGRFYCGVNHSNKSKAQLVRVKYKNT